MTISVRCAARGLGWGLCIASLGGCPEGQMAPVGAASADAGDTDGTATVALDGSGTAAADDTMAVDGDGSGGGTMGFGPVMVQCGDIPEAAEGADFSHTALPSGGDGDYTWAASGLPEGLSIDDGDGEIEGEPTTAGSYDVVLTLTDGEGSTAQQTCTVVVNPALATEQPSDPLADNACVSGNGTLLDLIVEGTGDGSPIECSVPGGTGGGRVPNGISVNPTTCAIEGTPEVDARFGLYAFIVRGEQNGVRVNVPYCVATGDSANTYDVDAEHSGATSIPQQPLVRFFDPTGPVAVGMTGDPRYTAIDASVCDSSSSCFFGFVFALNSSPFDTDTFDITDTSLVTDQDGERIGMEHGLQVSVEALSRSFWTRPWIQSVGMTYCLSTEGDACAGASAIDDNAGAQLEISIIMFPQAR